VLSGGDVRLWLSLLDCWEGFGFGIAPIDHLAIFEQRDHADAAADVSSHGGEEPSGISEPRCAAGEDSRENLSAFEVFLGVLGWRGRSLTTVEAKGHMGEMQKGELRY
jgi:hypothetical protein